MSLRDELIQVAAVAVAIVEDIDHGTADFDGAKSVRSSVWYRGDDILKEVADERLAQDEKWGPQHHDPLTWLAILMEEVGESAEEVWREAPGDTGGRELLEVMVELGQIAKARLELSDESA